jgi:hypothetical protein
MAAGLGFKTFNTGDVLSAADTNGYLMQGVLVFADAAARTAEITSPQEGQMSFLKDTNSTEYYSGSAWVAVSAGGVPTSLEFTAGKNKIINGDFGIWQRGTTTTFATPTSGGFVSDRWQYLCDDGGGGSGSKTVSQQAFTPGTAPVSGYEGQYFIRVNSTVASTVETYSFLTQYIEDVRTFAGQTITISFWAKAASNTTIPSVAIRQNFGSGGSTSVDTNVTTNIAVTTSWQRFSYSVALPSVSGKTIGSSSYLRIGLFNPTQATFTLDFWGVQVESGSTATSFQTATGTIQGELAACQRYYYRQTGDMMFGLGMNASTTVGRVHVTNPVSMRVRPTAIDYSLLGLNDTAAVFTVTSAILNIAGTNVQQVACTVASGLTQYRTIQLESANAAGFVGFSAEL